MRQQRDQLSEKLTKMTKEEILEYFVKLKTQKLSFICSIPSLKAVRMTPEIAA